MLYYLDTAIVVYAVEGQPLFRHRARSHFAALQAGGHRFVISELVRTECLIPAFGPGGAQRLADFVDFFHHPLIRTVSLTAAMHLRAAAIRGTPVPVAGQPGQVRRYGLPDALHLAAAIETGCDRFLTNDHRLAAFADIHVETLP